MALRRSDSAQSAWDLHLPRDDGDDLVRDQRRIRHLTAVLVRNLSLDPRRDELSAALYGGTQHPALDLLPTSGPSQVHFDDGALGVPPSPTDSFIPVLGRRRAGSAASWAGVPDFPRAEGQELVLTGLSTAPGAPARTRPRRSSSAGTLLGSASARIDEEPASPADKSSPASALASLPLRARSASRASLGSVGSSSTIRQAPRVPPPLQHNERPPPPSAAQFALKEKQRREDALRRRLVDSFISLELVPLEEALGADPLEKKGRNRSGSVASTRMQRSGSAGSVHGGASPRKGMRRRTTSSSLLSSSSTLPGLASTSTAGPPPPDPFFVSEPSLASMHAAFPVDPSSFLLPSTSPDSPICSPALPDDPSTASWPGLRESRLRVKVFARPSHALPPSPSASAKGKGKAQQHGDGEDWRMLAEWDVELEGLTSLGRDPTAFPSLPPNTLIFALAPAEPAFAPSSSSAAAAADTEYFTAPLPLLRRCARPAHSRRARAGAGAGADPKRALSEDEASPGTSASGSSDDEGNASDPGLGSGPSASLRARTRPRANTLRARAQAAEEARARRVLVLERSRRETRMVRAAGWDAERELAETQDRVDDLEAVRGAVEQELADELAELSARREALRARRARLEQARRMDEANQLRLEKQREELDEQTRSLADIAAMSRTRRTQLITLLSHIFPIEPVAPSPADEAPPHLLFSIVGLALPNSSFPPSYSDDALSSALGYAAQVTHLLAAYLGVPLCYPLRCRASRSVVLDEISMMKGPRAFPLYGRGVDQYRFDYGVFLLNKNIEQLMYSQGLTVLDLRNTLPNLKTLVLSLSYDPSHADYREATLLPAAPFADPPPPREEEEENPAQWGEPAPAARTRSSRSSSLASTIRAPRARSSRSRDSSRSSRRSSLLHERNDEGAADGGEGEGAPKPTLRGANGDAHGAGETEESPAPNGAATTPAPPAVTAPVARAEKRVLPASSTPASAPPSGPPLKLRVVKPASSVTGGGGYGAKIREGLWSAVAGNVAAGAAVAGGRVRGGEDRGE
ncbi:hypothetical protein JCM10449v2_006352 [Rhodotorula kratochvilovae]